MKDIYSLTQLREHFEGCVIQRLSIDAEWDWKKWFKWVNRRVKPKDLLTKQISAEVLKDGIIKYIHFVLWDNSLPKPFVDNVPDLYVIACDIDETHFGHIISNTRITMPSKRIPVLGFFSEVDLNCIMFDSELKELIQRGQVEKKRNINLSIRFDPETFMVDITNTRKCVAKTPHYYFVDLYGVFNSSLDDAFDAVGIDQPYKSLVNKTEKKNMRNVFEERTNEALKYALGDTKYLFELLEKRVEQINSLVEQALGFNPGFTESNFPRSSGKLTETIFRMWMARNYPNLVHKCELLADITSLNAKNFKKYQILLTSYCENGVVRVGKRLIPVEDLGKTFWDSNTISGLSHGSIPAIGSKNIRFGQTLAALVNGGRCINENPNRVNLKNVLDVDMSGCYGSTLAQMSYPVGVPTTIAGRTETHTKCRSLREMLPTISEFQNGLWSAVVHTSEDLSFQQDLIFSNPDITAREVRNKIVKQDFDTYEIGIERTHIDGGFCMINRQLINGVLTNHSLEILKAIATNQEWTEFLDKVQVDVIIGYRTTDTVSVVEYLERIDTCDKGFKAVNGDSEVDQRDKMWVEIPLKGFVQPFLDLRKSLKKQKQKKGDQFDLMQNACKLFVNTLYGVMASPFFTTSNAILANNITDRARCGVWKIAKALGTNMSITDGGAYQYDDCRVLDPNGKKPGIHVLANFERLNKHRSITRKPIVNFDIFYNLCKDPDSVSEADKQLFWQGLEPAEGDLHSELLDGLALKWVNDFWSVYGLELGFQLEHKAENTALEMTIFNKSDYLFVDPLKPKFKDGENPVVCPRAYSVKVRGAREDDHMKKQLLSYLAGHKDDCQKYQVVENYYKVNDLRAEASRVVSDNPLEPGMAYASVYTLKPNFNHLPFDTLAQRTYVFDNIERTVNELKKIQAPYIEKWSETGDEQVLEDMPSHPIFKDKPANMSFENYLIDVYMASGGDIALGKKHVKSKNRTITDRLIVRDYFYRVGLGVDKTQAKEEVADEYKISSRSMDRLIASYKKEFESLDTTGLLDHEAQTKTSKRYRVGTDEIAS
ncbi:hypothetical protein HC928_10310 [bacterium]|nr:hypothetical protein [bacterium]